MNVILRTEEQIKPSYTQSPIYLIVENIGGQDRITEGAWFTKEEAHDYATAISYRLTNWAIKPVGCRGNLKSLLDAHTIPAAILA